MNNQVFPWKDPNTDSTSSSFQCAIKLYCCPETQQLDDLHYLVLKYDNLSVAPNPLCHHFKRQYGWWLLLTAVRSNLYLFRCRWQQRTDVWKERQPQITHMPIKTGLVLSLDPCVWQIIAGNLQLEFLLDTFAQDWIHRRPPQLFEMIEDPTGCHSLVQM